MPDLLAEAWRAALTPPSGPVFVEVPVDLLTGEAGVPPVRRSDGRPAPAPLPVPDATSPRRRGCSRRAERPVLWAGGGVLRSGAWAELRALAERLERAGGDHVHGQGRFPGGPPAGGGLGLRRRGLPGARSRAQTWCSAWARSSAPRRPASTRCASPAGSSRSTPPRSGSARPTRRSASSATPRAVLGALRAARWRSASATGAPRSASRAAARSHRDGPRRPGPRPRARHAATTSRAAAGARPCIAWDMTILALLGRRAFPGARARAASSIRSARARSATPGRPRSARRPRCRARRTLAVAGDGGIHYALDRARQRPAARAAAKLLIVDDGGYGILREYQRDAFGETHAVDLVQPDFGAVGGPSACRCGPWRRPSLRGALDWAFDERRAGRGRAPRTPCAAHQPTP